MKTLLNIAITASITLLGETWITQTATATEIVTKQQPHATIVVHDGASTQIRDAANALQRYIQQSTGATLPITTTPGTGMAIHIGRSPYVDGARLKFETLDNDGFVLKGIDSKNYVIVGPTDWGTEFGVYDFLERYVGIRWLMPGENGVDVPTHSSLDVPPTEIREQPAYWSRDMSPFSETWTNNKESGGARAEWSRRNRLHRRIVFHHNLINLFSPGKYAKTHPEFYPIINGKRYEPVDDQDYNWQPDFLAPGIVDEAAKTIKQYFRDHPAATSYSLAMNDSLNFDESPTSMALDENKTNYLGKRDASNTYFTWANAVVTEVLKEFPDKWFGTLAYQNIAEPPTRVKPHPRIVPFLTYDRMKWLNPKLEKYNQELTKRWAAVSLVIGWYDYVYGNPYLVPRMYPHQMQKYLKWGHQNNVQVHYAELYPNWGEGPKPWVSLKLQWNPDQNIEQLLNDWYSHAVGPKAAPLLREYFEIWEKFWTTTAIRSKWFTPAGEYLPFTSPDYLADVQAGDVERSRRLIDKVVMLTTTPQQRWRAEVLRRSWDYYEVSAKAYEANALFQTASVTNETDALKLLEKVPPYDMLARRREIMRRLRDPKDANAITDYSTLDIDWYGSLIGDNWGTNLIWRTLPWAQRSPRVRAKIGQMAASNAPYIRDNAQLALRIIDGQGIAVTKNSTFEEGTDDKASLGGAPNVVAAVNGWGLWKGDSETGNFILKSETAFTGKYSLEINSMKNGAPTQSVPAEVGKYYAIAYIFAPAGQEVDGKTVLAIQGIGPDGKWVTASEGGRVEQTIRPLAGQWVSAVVPFEVKENQKGQFKTLQLIIGFSNFKSGQKVYLDDAGLFKIR